MTILIIVTFCQTKILPKKNKNKSDGLEIALNSPIAISGIILLGFLY